MTKNDQQTLNANWIFCKLQPQIRYMATNLLKNRNIPLEADDLVVESFEIIKNLITKKPDCNLTYLLNGCKYEFLNILKKYSTAKYKVLNEAIFESQNEDNIEFGYEQKFENNYWKQEILITNKLNKIQKQLLSLCFEDDKNSKEIASMLHISKFLQQKHLNSMLKQIKTNDIY
ncbi:sigma-70 family RNA polymerase sigma factor [[Mycoplasma] gypis]|uniref:Sigma-70 family RNA polymerase sigma factor n=1 Tax=[Mycoplasma] gypis TaxID=92404 RepID=A0ABZ2RMJ9_9BACT|nr:sigma-70 family RNA polymerase sigma factor [[Mycoplasma] gypis]MBN0919081.1 sigma-70 family RNA polymerase sigma factor [[Mycoplasma] gypis]